MTWETTDTQWTDRPTAGWVGDASASATCLSGSFAVFDAIVESESHVFVDNAFSLDAAIRPSTVSVDIEVFVGVCGTAGITFHDDISVYISSRAEVQACRLSCVLGDGYGGVMEIAWPDRLMHIQTTTKNPVVLSNVTENVSAFAVQISIEATTWAGDVLIFEAPCLSMSAYAWSSLPVIDTNIYDIGVFRRSFSVCAATTSTSCEVHTSTEMLEADCCDASAVVSSEVMVAECVGASTTLPDPVIESSCAITCSEAHSLAICFYDPAADHDADFSCMAPLSFEWGMPASEVGVVSVLDTETIRMVYTVGDHDCYWLCQVFADPFSVSATPHDVDISNDFEFQAVCQTVALQIPEHSPEWCSLANATTLSVSGNVCGVTFGFGDFVEFGCVNVHTELPATTVSGHANIYAEAIALTAVTLPLSDVTFSVTVVPEPVAVTANVPEPVCWNDLDAQVVCHEITVVLHSSAVWLSSAVCTESVAMAIAALPLSDVRISLSVMPEAVTTTATVADVVCLTDMNVSVVCNEIAVSMCSTSTWLSSAADVAPAAISIAPVVVAVAEGCGVDIEPPCSISPTVYEVDCGVGYVVDAATCSLQLSSLLVETSGTCEFDVPEPTVISTGNLAVDCWADNEYVASTSASVVMSLLEPDYVGESIWEKVRLISTIMPEKTLTSVIL